MSLTDRKDAIHLQETPTDIPTTVSTKRSNGCCQAFSGLMAATAIMTMVVPLTIEPQPV